MAEKRQTLKKVSGEALLKGIYLAEFTDGTVVECPLAAVNPAMRERFLQYGLKQKLDDSMAGAETIEEAVEELKSTWGAIVDGNWTIRVPGEGIEGGLFVRAYADFKELSLADAKAQVASLVEKNLTKNREANAGKKDAPEITERMVFNQLRAVALQKYPVLAAKYQELKDKKAAKQAAKGSSMEIEV